MNFPLKKQHVLPGFGPTVGYTIFYLSLIVLIPLSVLVINTAGMTREAFITAVTSPRVMASYRVTFGAALIAALINAVFGTLVCKIKLSVQISRFNLVEIHDLQFLKS
jgi:sulfate transport system permease protein